MSRLRAPVDWVWTGLGVWEVSSIFLLVCEHVMAALEAWSAKRAVAFAAPVGLLWPAIPQCELKKTRMGPIWRAERLTKAQVSFVAKGSRAL